MDTQGYLRLASGIDLSLDPGKTYGGAWKNMVCATRMRFSVGDKPLSLNEVDSLEREP